MQLLPAVRKQGMLRTLTAVEVANQTLAAQGHLSPRQAGQRHSYSHLPGTAPYLDEGMGIVPAAADSYQVRQYHCSCTAFLHPSAVPLLLHCLSAFSHCFSAPISCTTAPALPCRVQSLLFCTHPLQVQQHYAAGAKWCPPAAFGADAAVFGGVSLGGPMGLLADAIKLVRPKLCI